MLNISFLALPAEYFPSILLRALKLQLPAKKRVKLGKPDTAFVSIQEL